MKPKTTKRASAPRAKSKNANGAGKAKSKAKAAKPTAEQLSDQEAKSRLLKHRKGLMPLIEAKKAASKAVTDAFKKAEADGVSRVALKHAILLATPEGREKLATAFELEMTVERWLGNPLGHQSDMGFPKQSQSDKAFDEGYRAAMNDEPCKPPSNLAQPTAQRWMAGHHKGMAELNAARASEFKPLGYFGVPEQPFA
jgi:hypothetical protein